MNIDPAEIPKGSDYQWAALAVCGDESLGDVARLEKTGWRKVPKSRHPKLRSGDRFWIVDGGLVLMERPEFLTERAREWEQAKADYQVARAIKELGKFDDSLVVYSGRPIDMDASPVRKTTVKEWCVRNWWALKVWFRNLFLKET